MFASILPFRNFGHEHFCLHQQQQKCLTKSSLRQIYLKQVHQWQHHKCLLFMLQSLANWGPTMIFKTINVSLYIILYTYLINLLTWLISDFLRKSSKLWKENEYFQIFHHIYISCLFHPACHSIASCSTSWAARVLAGTDDLNGRTLDLTKSLDSLDVS